MKLSIIVPVYNVEDYIKECMDSLINIPIKDMEILVIDDGSLDNSINIVEKYEDTRIKIIHQKNGGLSSARNTGLKNANGKYILFVDSDDYIINQLSISSMITLAEDNKCDILIGNGYRKFENGDQIPIRRPECLYNKEVYSSEEYLKTILTHRSFVQVAWLNLYNREFLEKNSLKFKEKIYHEDLHFTPRALLKARKICVSKEFFYIYRHRENSIMTNKNQIKHAYDIFKIAEDLEIEFSKVSDVLLKQQLYELIVENIFVAVYKGIKEEKAFLKEEYVDLINRLNKHIKRLDFKMIIFILNKNSTLGYDLILIKTKLKNKIKQILKR